jgi:hypothetical protein
LARDLIARALVVTNPPQSGVVPERVAPLVGLTPEQVSAKVDYRVPEIWAADADVRRMEDAAAGLEEAGCKVVVMSSDELLEVPPQNRVRSFSFTDDGLVADVDGRDVPVPYLESVIGVFCRPRERPSGRVSAPRAARSSGLFSLRDRILETGSGATAAPDEETSPFFDIYVRSGSTPTRISVVQNSVNFAGLGRLQPRAAANMQLFVERCEDRFAHASVDRRLEGMRLRRDGRSKRVPMSEHRHGYSFASPGLNALLSQLSPTLEGITQPEFSTRLAYLTRAHTT